MSRVTSVTGYSSSIPATLLNCRGSLSEARGHSRCSVCTPKECVGTRTNWRDWVVLNRGITRSAGGRETSGCFGRAAGSEIIFGAAATLRAGFSAGCAEKCSQANAGFALISPLREMRPNTNDFMPRTTAETTFQPKLRGSFYDPYTQKPVVLWGAKMPLPEVDVNLLKTGEVP